MTHEQMTTLLERITGDKAFAASLAQDPKTAAGTLEIELSSEELEVIAGMSADELESFAAEQLAISDPAKRRAAC